MQTPELVAKALRLVENCRRVKCAGSNVQSNWKKLRSFVRHTLSHKGGPGWENSFEMAIMVNRYDVFICPVKALAIYLSCTCFGEGANMGFRAGDLKITGMVTRFLPF